MKYTIQKTLAFNKRAEVLLADYKDPIHPGLVLVKTSLPDLSDKVMEHLKFAKSLNHKNLFNIIDFGKCKNYTPTRYYVTHRYIPGVTLTQVLSKLDLLNKKAPIPFILHIIFSLCNVLEYIHTTACGTKDKEALLHGNICPDNILITYNGDVYLLDAGISSILTDRYTGTMLVQNTGTIFHHPEAHFGGPVKPSHELYSLSLLFLSLLVGKKHFDQFYIQKDPQKIKTIGKVFPSIPEDIVKIITKGTRFGGLRRFMRFESVSGFYHALLESPSMQHSRFMTEIASLLIYTLFNHHEDLSDTHHQEQRIKALKYIREGHDNSLKMLLRDRLNVAYPEDESEKTPTDTYTDLLDEVFDTFTEESTIPSKEESQAYFDVTTEADSSSPKINSAADKTVLIKKNTESSRHPDNKKVSDRSSDPQKPEKVHDQTTDPQSVKQPTIHTEAPNQTTPSTAESMPMSITEILNIEQLLKKSSSPDTALHNRQKDNKNEVSEKQDTTAGKSGNIQKFKDKNISFSSGNSKTPFFGNARIGNNHPFVKIVTNPLIINADIITPDTLDASLPKKPDRPSRKTTEPSGSSFDSFASLLKNSYENPDIKQLEPFSNLLKKETDHV